MADRLSCIDDSTQASRSPPPSAADCRKAGQCPGGIGRCRAVPLSSGHDNPATFLRAETREAP